MDIDTLILELIESGRRATDEELSQIVAHVAQAPFASRLVRISPGLRDEFAAVLGKPVAIGETMNANESWDLAASTDDHIESYLLNYKLLIKDLPELADLWVDLDEFEHHHYQMMFSQTWGMRYQLGDLYGAGRLTAEQEAELAGLDEELIQLLDDANLCYGLDLQSVAQLFTWGTPLAQSDEIIHIPIRLRALSEIAPALAALGEEVPA